jgi:pimeloyl-ACP methyl ester carboxylesterase
MLAGLVLVDFSPEPDPPGVSQVLSDFDAETRSFSSRNEYRGWLGQRRPLAHPAALDRYANYSLLQAPNGSFTPKRDPRIRHGRSSSLDANRSEMLWRCLSTISCPTLVVRGSASAVLSQRVAERIVTNALPDGRLSIVKMAGHAVMADNPEGFNSALKQFVLSELPLTT